MSTSQAPAKRRRGGRPPASWAGEVDRRILDAATQLFLRDGYDATSFDRIAARANAGKASLYARYSTKQELFTAVVRRMVDRTLLPSVDVPSHLPTEERLRETGHRLLEHALVPEAVALMRVCMSIAPRMPDLARLVDRIGREGGIAQVARAIAGREATPERLAQARPAAEQFIDMVFVPHQMRALIGDDRELLRETAPRRVNDAIALLRDSGKLIASEEAVGDPLH
ncbi:TetR/AcrR family transcriptional regulator [Qipengyuania sp.]|uniref:TetR/AcrR family transcriptional regulator n=1 Tax=Qipengyuania sp. TaxID=2004515 RepID=UPI0035C7B8C7